MTTATIGTHSRQTPGHTAAARAAFASWRHKARATVGRTAANAAGHITSLRSATLTVTGLGFVDAAAYQVTLGVGLLVTGASVLVLEWLSSD